MTLNDFVKTDDVLVIYCDGCGNLCFAVFNDPEFIAECASSITEALKKGGKIAYVSNQTVRENFKRCACVTGAGRDVTGQTELQF